ncbi:hypothetical protein [Micromonospora sp. DT231]|uniref:hypothetical protein n=1 Tax=Micromonospora sp. DT231 TaxID=3416526 RepID=UPI003CE7ABCE
MAATTDARRLGEHFVADGRDPGVSRDAFFDPSSETRGEPAPGCRLLRPGHPRRVPLGGQPRDDEPAMLLREHGFALPADAVAGVVNMPDKTRGGIYAGAQEVLMCVTEPSVTAWGPTDPRRVLEFNPAAFVVSIDVLYLLSSTGGGNVFGCCAIRRPWPRAVPGSTGSVSPGRR